MNFCIFFHSNNYFLPILYPSKNRINAIHLFSFILLCKFRVALCKPFPPNSLPFPINPINAYLHLGDVNILSDLSVGHMCIADGMGFFFYTFFNKFFKDDKRVPFRPEAINTCVSLCGIFLS